MKNLKYLLLIMVATFMSLPYVKADTFTVDNLSDFSIYKSNKDLIEEQSNILIDYYNTNLKNNYKYYFLEYGYFDHTEPYHVYLFCTNDIGFSTYTIANMEDTHGYEFDFSGAQVYYINNSNVELYLDSYNNSHTLFHISDNYRNVFDFRFMYYANFPILYNISLIKSSFKDYNYDTLHINNFYSDSSIIISEETNIPYLKDLLKYNSWDDYIGNQIYTDVNLDNYEYVILNLKDYSKKDAFETNLQVKGMIGITPVYEFGKVEKAEITDRCNISYKDYTDYRFFILKNDIINNSVYYVKSCENGSSFKYDSSVFDITFVTSDNVNDPVITVDGVEYHTIPFKQLSNSANKNEEENFVPGASEGFHPIESLTDYISSFWNSLTTFMSLVTKFFNTLPIEIRAITITFFTTACTLGLFKILKR